MEAGGQAARTGRGQWAELPTLRHIIAQQTQTREGVKAREGEWKRGTGRREGAPSSVAGLLRAWAGTQGEAGSRDHVLSQATLWPFQTVSPADTLPHGRCMLCFPQGAQASTTLYRGLNVTRRQDDMGASEEGSEPWEGLAVRLGLQDEAASGAPNRAKGRAGRAVLAAPEAITARLPWPPIGRDRRMQPGPGNRVGQHRCPVSAATLTWIVRKAETPA